MQNPIKEYLKSVDALYAQGITTEHSFRGALETLLKNMTGFTVVNEAQHIACGAPDLTLLKGNIPVGYVEAKDIGKNLNAKEYKNQFDRYKKALDNLIITDYLTFRLFEGENFITEVSIGKILPDKIEPIPENFNKLIELIRTFSRYNGKPIANSKQLAEFMAAKTQLLTEVIEKTLNDETALRAQLQDFQEVLLPTMDDAQFADMYAQTIAYGMFVARLQDNLTPAPSPNGEGSFTRQQAANLIPKSNPFLRKLFQYIAGYDIDENICWIVDSLADMFNYVDIDAIHKEFVSKDKDPFLHFYEDFLTRYDKSLKNAKGAYYTPQAVVRFIVNAVDDILKNDFGIANGLADNTYLTPNPSPKERGEGQEVSAYHTVADVGLWKNLLEKAKEGRKNPTKAEYLMWKNLRNNKLGHKFRRQHPISEFIPDFVCLEKKLVVEIDGGYHNEKEQIEYDRMRSEYLNEYGYNILRFTNDEVLHDIHTVLQSIRKKLSEPTSPLSFGEGLGVRLHKVQILDPATGTGTFLAEVVRRIYQKFAGNEGVWDNYVSEHLIPRLNGFEIMMSPYTMAHLKIETLLQDFGRHTADNQRLRIYLTDSLEEPKQHPQKLGLYKWLSDEATEAQKIKNNIPVMVILGNPPYSGESQNKSKDKKKRNWIETILDVYKIDDKGIKIPDTKWVNNDYVKFIRFGQHFIHKNGEGILAYITDNSFLDSLSFRGMRYNLLKEFDKIYILNLHGNSLKKETAPDSLKDENVFDIMQGVSINIFVKTGKKNETELANTYYFDLYGKRQEKYNFLLENNLQSIGRNELQPAEPDYFFVPKDFSLQEEYEKGFKIHELFYLNGVGICSKRDETAFQNSKNEIIAVLNDFKNLPESEIKQKYKTEMTESRDKKTAFAKQNILNLGIDEKSLQKVTYRPFETKWTYFTNKSKGFLAYPVYDLMQHFTKGENFGMVVSKQCDSDWRYIFITKNIADLNLIATAAKFGGGYIFPLYLYHEHFGQTKKVANLNAEIKGQISETATPEQIFDYIYAVLHSPSYREKYKEFLKIDFPRIPYPKDADQFNKFAKFGERLRHLHLMEFPPLLWRGAGGEVANFPKSENNTVENSFTPKSNGYHDRKVWINDAQYFDNVPAAAWNFYIGGYQPAQKWLKDRKGRTLTYEDIEHYRKIIFALNETDRIMNEIDLAL